MLLRLATTWHRIATYASSVGDIFSLTGQRGLLRKKAQTSGLGHYAKKYSDKHYAIILLHSRIDSVSCYKGFYSHILVCLAWHGPRPSPRHEVDHIDRDKWNNRASNLRWVTRSENIRNTDRYESCHGKL